MLNATIDLNFPHLYFSVNFVCRHQMKMFGSRLLGHVVDPYLNVQFAVQIEEDEDDVLYGI